MEAPSACPILPPEILAEIVGALDPAGDRQCLLDLMTVSRSMWKLAARRLYAHLAVDSEQLGRLVSAGKDLSSRVRASLAFVQQLRIHPQLTEATLLRLWDAAVPGQALFPNVRRLIYVDHPSYHLREHSCRHQPPANVVLFNTADVCFTGSEGYSQLFLLPIRTVRSITCHDAWFPRISRAGFPSAWRAFRLFDNTSSLESFEVPFERYRWGDCVKKLRWRGPEHQPRIQICLLSDDPDCVPPILDEMETLQGRAEWRPSTSGLQFKQYPRLEPHGDCPPCDLCGQRWMSCAGGSGWRAKQEWDL